LSRRTGVTGAGFVAHNPKAAAASSAISAAAAIFCSLLMLPMMPRACGTTVERGSQKTAVTGG
jgi:hypothetical protein